MTTADLAADLLAKVRTVPALATSAALSLGGRQNDPGLAKIPLPVAWVTLARDQADELPDREFGPPSGFIPSAQVMMSTWSVHVFIAYVSDTDLIAVQLPLLDAVIAAIHATEAPSGYRWRYVGQQITLVYPDRLAYEQRYTITFSL